MNNLTLNDNFTENDVIKDGPLADKAEGKIMEVNIYPFVFVIFYMVIGFIGNSVVIYIFTVKWKLTKTTIFILTLAGVDLMSCIINMPTEAAILWHPMDFDYDVLCKISRYTTFIASASSSFVLIAISIDRYVMICRPFLGRELGVQYAKRTCIIAVLLGMITTWPSLIFYGTYSYQVEQFDNQTGKFVKIESKTCLISNFYVDNYRLPAGFYFFLFGAHGIMFVILTLMYMMIGRRLYISTSGAISNEKRHSLKYFGISMMSAITGSVPNSPADNRDRVSWSSRSPRAVSLENINRIDRTISFDNVNRVEQGSSPATARYSNETTVSIVLNGAENVPDVSQDVNNHPNPVEDATTDKRQNKTNEPTEGQKIKHKEQFDVKETNLKVQNAFSGASASDSSFNTSEKQNKKKLLHLNIGTCKKDKNAFAKQNGLMSSTSTGSPYCLTPMSPTSSDGFRGNLYRSQSLDSRARLNRIISDDLQRAEVKEFSLRRNTLIMRMVTIAFVVSFLPYLVIVTLRYSNPDIPTKLSKAEQILYHVFLRTYFINSMINPFIYGFMNVEFRAKIKELFCKFCANHNIDLS